MSKPDVEFALFRDEWGHPILAEYKVNNRQPDNMPVLSFLQALRDSDNRLSLVEVERLKSIKKPDVVLELNRDLDGHISNIRYTVHNREPDNYPCVEFQEILNMLFCDKEQPVDLG